MPVPSVGVVLDKPATSGRSKRSSILDAAVAHFGSDGFDGTKWATIAEEVGIGQTALYHYFESKVHCLLTIMSLELSRSHDRFLRATAGITDDLERLDAAVGSAYDVTPRDALAARVLVSNMELLVNPRPSEREEAERRRARGLVREIEDEWERLIKAGAASGAFAGEDPRMDSLSVLSLIISVWRWYRPGGNADLRNVSSYMQRVIRRMLGA